MSRGLVTARLVCGICDIVSVSFMGWDSNLNHQTFTFIWLDFEPKGGGNASMIALALEKKQAIIDSERCREKDGVKELLRTPKVH